MSVCSGLPLPTAQSQGRWETAPEKSTPLKAVRHMFAVLGPACGVRQRLSVLWVVGGAHGQCFIAGLSRAAREARPTAKHTILVLSVYSAAGREKGAHPHFARFCLPSSGSLQPTRSPLLRMHPPTAVKWIVGVAAIRSRSHKCLYHRPRCLVNTCTVTDGPWHVIECRASTFFSMASGMPVLCIARSTDSYPSLVLKTDTSPVARAAIHLGGGGGGGGGARPRSGCTTLPSWCACTLS